MQESTPPPPPLPLERRKSLSEILPPSPSARAARKFSWAGIKQRVISAAVGGSSADAENWSLDELPASFFDLAADDAKGASLPFSTFTDNVCLVCNVASN